MILEFMLYYAIRSGDFYMAHLAFRFIVHSR